MSGPTLGPWFYKGETGDGKVQFVESDQTKDNWNCLRAEIESDDCNYEMAIANARLISACPELFEVALDIISDCKGIVNPGLYSLAEKAIAKATGKDVK
jgi:hypothetical protein